MDANTFTILTKVFPKEYGKISRRIVEDPELASIIHDLIECVAALTWLGPHKNDQGRREMYRDLLEDLKNEVLLLVGDNGKGIYDTIWLPHVVMQLIEGISLTQCSSSIFYHRHYCGGKR